MEGELSTTKIETSQSSQHEFKEIEAEVVHEKVDDSPIKIETSPSQHEFEEIEAEVIHENKCLSLIPYDGSLFFNSYEKSLFFNLAEKQGDNMAEPKKDEMEDVNIDYPRTSENEITISVHKELEARVAMLKALPSPERKRILGLTPRKISEASIKQTSSSSVNRFAKTHEKAFSQMPSIMTHYAAQKTKKAEEIQDEINRKRKDLGGMQPLIKKRKLANSTAKEVAKSSVRLGVTQHVLKKKTKEGVAKKPKPSLLPRRVSGIQKKMSK
ncbi:hypothetical protein RhiirB3_529739 [Rhizophagus irregularis]|nr:hypothetical protein RhiirB3_529739 [Rhizophagus irregularis]